MAQAHGKDSVLKIHDGTSLRDITPYTKNIDVNRSQDANDTTTKGAEGKTYRPGLTDGELRITGLWDDAALVGPRPLFKTLMGGEVATTFEWGPEGSTTGMEKDSGGCCLIQYDESSPVDNMVAFTATLKISGDVTSGVWP
jgi:hypothetical protein